MQPTMARLILAYRSLCTQQDYPHAAEESRGGGGGGGAAKMDKGAMSALGSGRALPKKK